MTISVTQDHITRGKRGSSCSCPIALALFEATGKRWYVNHFRITKYPSVLASGHAVSQSVERFARRFDAGKAVKPFSFRFAA